MNLRQAFRRLTKAQNDLKANEAGRLLAGPTINALAMRYQDTGELPENRLQATQVLLLRAEHEFRMSTVPSTDDGGKHFEECRQAMYQAAVAHDNEREAWGLKRLCTVRT